MIKNKLVGKTALIINPVLLTNFDCSKKVKTNWLLGTALSVLLVMGTATAAHAQSPSYPVTPQAISVCPVETVLYEELFDDRNNAGWADPRNGQNGLNPPVGFDALTNNIANSDGTLTDVTIDAQLNGGSGVASPSGGSFVSAFDNAGNPAYWINNANLGDLSAAIGGAIYIEKWNWRQNATPADIPNQAQDFAIFGTTGRLYYNGPDNTAALAAGQWETVQAKLEPSANWRFMEDAGQGNLRRRVARNGTIRDVTAQDFVDVLSNVLSVGSQIEVIGAFAAGDVNPDSLAERFALDTVRIASCADLGADFSDAPTTTLGGASHSIFPNFFLGGGVSPDTGDFNSAAANGDDDDGVIIPSLTQGESASITANVTGAGGLLQGWMDFDGDGIFDADEQIATDLQLTSGTSGTINVPIDVPTDAVTTQTFARFRWSTTSALNATDAANDGEVEDYALTITEPTPIEAVNDDFTSAIIPSTGGTTVSVFADDDYDGATPTETTVDVSLTDLGGLTGATINADGTIDVPAGVDADTYTLTYQICEAGATTNCDTATVMIEVAPAPTLPALTASFDTCAAAVPGTYATGNSFIEAIWLANSPPDTLEPDATFLSNSDDVAGGLPVNFAAGVTNETFSTNIRIGGIETADNSSAYASSDFLTYTFTTEADISPSRIFSTLRFVIDGGFNITAYLSTDPTFATAKTLIDDAAITGTGLRNVQLDEPLFLEPATTYHIRVVYHSANNTTNMLFDDFGVITAACADYGDAPTTDTQFFFPSHLQEAGTPTLFLGSTITNDITSFNTLAANGDGASDDGVSLPTLRQGESVVIPVSVAQSAEDEGYLQAWADWDGNSRFLGAVEQIADDLQDDDNDGIINVSVTVPADATTAQTHLRFRWSSTPGLNFFAAANDGEIEDYAVTIEEITPIDAVNDDFTSAAITTTGGTTASVFADDDYDGATPTETSVDVTLTDLDDLIGATINADGTIDVPVGNIAGTYTLSYQICEAGATTNCDTATVKIEVITPVSTGPASCSIAQSVSENLVPARTLNTSCVADVGVTSDGSSANPGYCPISPTSDYEISYGYNLPANDRMYSLKVWANAGGVFNDGELRTFDLEVDYTSSSGAPATLSMPSVNLGDTTSLNDPKSVTFMESGQAVSLRNVSEVRISNLGHANTGPIFRELQGACGDDFSDAPANYAAAIHKFDPQTRLGATNTTDLTASNSNDDAGDDGVTLPALTRGNSAAVSVAATGAGGFLQGWVDFNGDGDFDDTGEQIATDLQLTSGTTGTINVPVNVPADAVTTQTFARFRWSTTSGLNATATANDGEVEDYALTISTPIDAVNDDFTSAAITTTGGTTASVFADDDYDGATPTETSVDVSLTDLGGLTGATINADGTIDVPAGAAADTYTLTYQICEAGATTNCDTATVMIEVENLQADLSVTKTNTPGVNDEVDQTDDVVISGATTTYTIVVTNNGPDSVTGALVKDVPSSGLTCDPTNPVTLTGDGVPTGSFTIAELTGVGITLDTLNDGQSTTLSYSCEVN